MKDLPVAHLERTVAGRTERITVNQTDYACDAARYGRKGWRVKSLSDGRMSDFAVGFMARQAEKEIARAANPRHPARHDVRRRWQNQQAMTNIRTRSIERPSFKEIRAMRWPMARGLVKELTGENPRSWAQAEELLAAMD